MSERIGRLCEKHDEWCPDGECRWCESPVWGQSLVERLPVAQPLLRLDGSVIAYDGCSRLLPGPPRVVAVDWAPLPPEIANQIEEFRRWLNELVCRGWGVAK